MNKVKYFYDTVSIEEALVEPGSDTEQFLAPEDVPAGVRNTMEELAYRTAVWYNEDDPRMYYVMTVQGIKVRVIDEDSKRSDDMGRVPVSGEEPRLLG